MISNKKAYKWLYAGKGYFLHRSLWKYHKQQSEYISAIQM